MERSLTVLLPVHNAQSTLAASVLGILEVVSELTPRIELVIIDDGSDDATSEVAHELTRGYPQVCAVRHGKRLGHEAAISVGLQHSRGEMILILDEPRDGPIDEIVRLWRAALPHQTQTADTALQSDGKRTRFSGAHSPRRSSYQLIDRRKLEKQHASSRPGRPNYLARFRAFALEE